jgi:hypothetical protein
LKASPTSTVIVDEAFRRTFAKLAAAKNAKGGLINTFNKQRIDGESMRLNEMRKQLIPDRSERIDRIIYDSLMSAEIKVEFMI